MVGKIIERALKSLSDNQVVINRDVWLKVHSGSELPQTLPQTLKT